MGKLYEKASHRNKIPNGQTRKDVQPPWQSEKCKVKQQYTLFSFYRQKKKKVKNTKCL